MSTLGRLLIFIGEFLIFSIFEFFYIKKQYTMRKNSNISFIITSPKKYIVFSIILYIISNVIAIFGAIALLSNEIPLSYNKLALYAIIKLIITFWRFLSHPKIKEQIQLVILLIGVICGIFFIIFIVVLSPLLYFNFSTPVSSKELITEYTDVNKLIKCDNNKYILLYNENGEEKQEVIPKNNIEAFEYSNSVDIKKIITISTVVNYELKEPKLAKSTTYYYISIPKNIVIDMTNVNYYADYYYN